jgi:type II secretory pathway predicted ATPase ExeA
MQTDYEYYKKFNWSTNPFTLSITPELMVGYSEQTNTVLSHIHNLHKFALIIGPTGSGKTTMLMWLRAQLMAYKKFFPFYIPKPPKSSDDLMLLLKSAIGYNFLDKMRNRNLTIYNISQFIQRKIGNKQLVLLIDEIHESSFDTLEWIRTITDSIPNLSVIIAGLPIFENNLETKLPTLWMRINTKVYLNTLSRAETESLILKRINNAEGKNIAPFTSDSIDKIFEITGGFPREIIKVCDILVKMAAEKNITSITKGYVEETLETPKLSDSVQIKSSITNIQKQILEVLSKNPNLTPSSVIDKMDTSEYKNRNNAIRSINNILKRLLNDDLVERKKLKNTYFYSLSRKAKTIFTEA